MISRVFDTNADGGVSNGDTIEVAYEVAYMDAERPPEIAREGVFTLGVVVGATGCEPATS